MGCREPELATLRHALGGQQVQHREHVHEVRIPHMGRKVELPRRQPQQHQEQIRPASLNAGFQGPHQEQERCGVTNENEQRGDR